MSNINLSVDLFSFPVLDQMKQESFKREEKMEARHFPGRKVAMLAEVLGHSHDGGYLPS